MENIIFKIKKEIEKRGISETALARKIDTTQKTLNNLLAGRTKKPDIEVIKKLVTEFGLDIAETTVAAESTSLIQQQINIELAKMTERQQTDILAICQDINNAGKSPPAEIIPISERYYKSKAA